MNCQKLKKIKINKPDGAFYVFPDVSNFLEVIIKTLKLKIQKIYQCFC